VRGTLCTATFDNVSITTGGPPPPDAVPPAPTNLVGNAPAYDRINLAWSDNASNEGGYEIQMMTGPAGFFTAGNLAANATATTVLNLSREVTHYFRVRAFNAAGNSAFSNVIAVTTPPEPVPPTLAAPTNLRVTATTSSTVALAWVDNASSEIGYHIGRSTDGVNFDWSGWFANSTSIEVTGLQPTATYYFRVRAYQHSADGRYYIHSASSNTVTATTTVAPPPPVPPNAPSNLVATAVSSSQINLTWTDNSNNENGFEIVRSTDNRTFSHVAGPGANVTSYVDTGLAAATTYYYYVRALNSAGASPATVTVSATTQASSAPPATWQSIDVGNVGAAGSTSVSGTGVTIRGSGEDIWGTQDAFHFHSRPLTGDGEISVQVLALDNTDTWAKAGVMLRASNEPGSPYVFIYVNPSFTVAWQHRETTGGNPSSDGIWGWANASLKIVRAGNTFSVYYLDGGANWALARAFSFPMPTTIRAGLAVTSHRRGTLASASFERLSVRQADGDNPLPPAPPAPPSAPTGLAATVVSGGEVRLTWADNATNETGYQIYRATGISSTVLFATIGANSSSYSDTAVQPGHSYVYDVRAINAAGASNFTNTAYANVPAAPGPDWSTGHIGNYGRFGSFTDGSPTLTVRGSGEDIWANADGFYFVYKPLRGDGQIVARVQGLENTHTWAKAGLMIRESLAAGSRHAFVFMTYNSGGLFHARTAVGGTTSIIEGPWWADPPYWLKIERRGNTFTAHTSPDGVTWTLLTTETIEMGSDALIGLAVTAHDVSKLNAAIFNDVQISSP
jgi:regulation of enolase protein 1 (concanavalin A-like superfamily)